MTSSVKEDIKNLLKSHCQQNFMNELWKSILVISVVIALGLLVAWKSMIVAVEQTFYAAIGLLTFVSIYYAVLITLEKNAQQTDYQST